MALKKCPECGQNISSRAKACPHCGKRRTTLTTKIVAGFFILAVAASIYGSFQADQERTERRAAMTPAERAAEDAAKESEAQRAGLRIRACAATERAVKEHLKAPSSAKFPGCSAYEYRTNDAMDTWYVAGGVDSQNSFGAMIRSRFSVILTRDENNFVVASVAIE